MKHTAAPPSQPQKASGRSPAASQLRGGRLTKLDGEVASCAPSLGRTSSALLSSASLAGILSGAFLAMTAQEAQAACTEISGAWTCTGVVTAAQSIKRSGSAISVNLDSGFDMDVAQGVGFTLEQSGAGGIAFVQAAGGQEIVGHSGAVHATNSGAGGISITATGEIRKTGRGAVLKAVNSDASGGSVSVSVGSVIGSGADGHAIQVTNSGAGTTAVTASGSVSSGAGEGDGVNVETGKGSSSVTISVATVTGSRTGLRVSHRGAGSVSVSATGTVKASGGYGGSHALYVANRDSDSSITVAVATVTAKGTGAVDGIHVLQMHGGAVTVIASGSVSSAGRHGIFVDRRGQSGTPGQNVRRDVNISVSGSVTGGGGYRDAAIKVNANSGDNVRIVLRSGAVVGRAGEAGIVESDGNAFVDLRDVAVNGGIRLGSGRDTLNAGWRAKISGGVNSGDGDDTLTVTNGAEVSGGVRLLDGNDILTVSGGAKISGAVGLGHGNDRLFVGKGAKIFGDVNFWHGNDRLTVSGRAKISGTVDFGEGNNTLTISEVSRISGDVNFGSGNDRLTVSGGAEVSGTVDLGDGNNTLTISEVSRILGDVDFGSGSDTLTVGGGSKISGTVDFGNGNDNLNFGPGFSEIGKFRGAEGFTFESGAVALITDTSGTDLSFLDSLEIKSGVIAMLHNAGHKYKVGSIRLKPGGTLNIADGVAGKSGNNSPHFNNVALLLGPDQELNGTLIIDANFAQSWADVLGWDGAGTRNWRGTVLIEPAVLEGRKGNSAIVTSSLSASQIRVPQGFSVVFDTDWQQFAIRQDIDNGACTGAGSGAFTCKNLIYKTQSFSVSGEALKVALDSSSVVHALAGTQQGLTLRQSGAGGISLTQSASDSRIAAAGHAIHAINAGAGSVSVTLTGPVVGGLTGRVADADGIVAEGGATGGSVHLSAASVTGLRHGISASGGGGVSVEASGSVTGRSGDGVKVTSTAGGSVHLSAASVTGLRHGIYALADGSVSVEASGSLTGRFGNGVKVTNLAKGLSSTGSVAISVATVTGGRTGVWATHRGAGSVSITSTGPVVGGLAGRMPYADGIFAEGGTARGSVRISAASVTGLRHGIYALADGSVSVEASGSLTGRFGNGVKVTNLAKGLSSTGSVAISVATVTGGRTGVWATHRGAGSVSITSTGPVVGGLAGRMPYADGIFAEGGTARGSVRISAASVTGLRHGIYALADGAVSVEASGSLTGRLWDGVKVTSVEKGLSAAGSVAISVATVTGGRTGVWVSHGGTRSVSIRATGTVKSSGGPGHDSAITVKNHTSYSSITIAVATITAQGPGSGASGIYVVQPHRGAVAIFASGAVSSAGHHGIFVDQRSRGGNMHGDVKIGVSGSITSAAAAIKVDSDLGDGVRISLESGAVVDRAGADAIIESRGNAVVDVKAGVALKGNVNLGLGNNTLTVSGATVSGGVRMFDGRDTLTVIDGAKVSGGVYLGEGNDTVTISDGAKVHDTVALGAGDDTLTVSGATFFGTVRMYEGNDTVIFSDGAKVHDTVHLGPGDDTLIVTEDAQISGTFVGLHGGNDTLIISDGATVSGNLEFGDGDDTLIVSGGTLISNRVYFWDGDDSLIFGPGLSKVVGYAGNVERLTFESGAVATPPYIGNTRSISIEIKGGAVASLRGILESGLDSIRLKQGGTLSIAGDGARSLGPDQEFNGTLVIATNFARSHASGLAWNGKGSRNWRGTLHIEPAVLAERKGSSAAITGDLSASQLTAPKGFSIVYDSQSGKMAIRQDMASGSCTSAGSGAFACRDLIHETQSLSASGEALSVTLDRAGVVHALAGAQRGLSLSQSGTGGLSLTQSSTGSRIAAAGHAIYARNAGAGDVSVTVTGRVVGGLTGMVPDADGIAAKNGADGSGVHISAASVAGLRHGIAASAGGGDVSVEASGSVTGKLGDGVRAVAPKGGVTVSAASAAGARAGIFGSGTEAVSISASGAAKSTGEEGAGIDGLASGSGRLSISAAEATGDAFGIRAVSQGSGSVSVKASGVVKATGGEGVAIYGLASGSGPLSISAAEATGGAFGIRAVSKGPGSVSVTASDMAKATGGGGAAIYGLAAGGGSLSISAAGASGGSFGIRAVGRGSGTVSVSASGGVESMNGASRHGVHARASGTGGLTVSVDGAVRGGETGITAIGGEGGDVAVTAFGRVAFGSGQVDGAAGIHAAARNGDLTVSATGEWLDRIVGYGDGIRAVSSGTGAVSISAAMEIQTRNGDAIVVNRTKAGSVGISVSNLTMALRRPGTAGTLAAIRTDAPSDSSVTISLNSGAHLRMPGADAVAGGAGDAAVTVKSGATVQGRIALGSGTDTLVFDGGAFSGVERMDGGAGNDTLRFASGTGTLHATVRSEGLKGWERIVVESGAALSGGVRLAADSGSLEFRGSAPSGALDGGSGTANTLSLVNVGTASVPASGLTGWETIAIGAGSEVSFGSGAHTLTTQTLKVETGGTLNVGKDADTGDALTVSGDFAGGGTVALDANFMPNAGASDRLKVTGDARGSTSVVFAKVGESGPVDDTARPMRIDGVISVAGAAGAGAFVLGSPIQFGTVSYSLAFDADNGEYDLLMTGTGGDAGALSHGAAAAAGALHFGPAATEALHSGPASAAALHMVSAATAATLGAQAAAAGLAAASRAACTEAPSGSGAFSCGGARIGSPQRLGAAGATALSVTLDTRTEVDTNGTAFSLTQSGAGGIAFERKEGGAAIRAKGDAIAARNAGGGFVSISARGAIAAGGDGVSAVSDADGEGVRIDVATVAAGGDGVSVEAAAGGVSVTADDVKGRGAGIRVRTGDGGTGVEISAGSTEGGADGISVDHGGGGEVRISATGAVSGARGDGVRARSDAGSISVRVSGEVSGGAAAGTAAIRTDGASAAVTLEDGASVRATGSGSAVMDGAGAALVTVREGASILGGVSLGAGADELVLAGGDFGGITALDGGPGRDALRIEAGRGSLPALSNGAVSGVESVIVSGDAVIEGDLLLGEGAGELVFADGARIDGHGRLDGGGGASLSLRGVSGEMDAARLSGWTSLEIGEGSRVTLAGPGLGRDAAESLFVAGTMAFGSDARAGDAFTVEGDFEGGGRVEIDADLAAGSADRLVIEGDVSGTTEIALRDLTPSGAEPSGAEMTVVSVGGEADASAFRLAGGAVARGAFLYDLRMAPDGGVFSLVADGGVSDTGAALRSSDAAIARGLARAATLQARAAARAATSVWARIGSAATFAERGAALAGRDAVDLSARKTRPVWMRLHGDRWDYGAGGAAMIDSSGFEVGMDLLSRESSGGKWIAGLTAQYGTVGAEAAAGGGVGRQGASGYGVGATLSWLGYGGFYADAQAQAGISDSDFSSDTGGAIRSGVSARTAVAALELGWRVAASDSATIVPQAQISMSGVSGDGFVSGSLDVAESSAASLDGRIGLAAEIALREGYLRFSGSLLRALSELDGTVINGRTVAHGLPDGWAEFAVGGSLDLSEDRVLFLDGTWRTGLGGGGGDAGGASISGGLKVNW